MPLAPLDRRIPLEAIASARFGWSVGILIVLNGVQYALGAMVLLVIARIVLRNEWVSVVAWTLVVVALFVAPAIHSIGYAAAAAALMVAVLLRFGLVAFALMMMFERAMTRLPITLDLAAWYAGPSLVVLLGVGALALYGLQLVLNGQPDSVRIARASFGPREYDARGLSRR